MARSMDPEELIGRASTGDRRALARIISLVEDGEQPGRALLALLFGSTGGAHITGLTGAPGGGKSTLTDRLITSIRSEGTEVAVVAVDPSSPFTGGAILGDRVRMQGHIDDPGVYIRSLASRGHLGGISAATPRAISVLDAIGFPEIVVETVGVGQAEVDIAADADTTVVVVNPGWGDAIQAAKAGLLEIGDVFVVNKADRPGSAEAVRDLKSMLELGGDRSWWPPVLTAVATTGEGVEALWNAIKDHRRHLTESGELQAVRKRRLIDDLEAAVTESVRARVVALLDGSHYDDLVRQILERRLDPWTAADRLTAGGQ